jgi:hypothetical protein
MLPSLSDSTGDFSLYRDNSGYKGENRRIKIHLNNGIIIYTCRRSNIWGAKEI